MIHVERTRHCGTEKPLAITAAMVEVIFPLVSAIVVDLRSLGKGILPMVIYFGWIAPNGATSMFVKIALWQ